STPEEALRHFIADVNQHRAEAVWSELSAASRAELKRESEALARASGGTPETSPAKLLFERAELVVLRAPEAISVASPLGTDVTRRVAVKGGESANIHMVREGNAWKVDLLASLEPLPPFKPRTSTTAATSTSAEP